MEIGICSGFLNSISTFTASANGWISIYQKPKKKRKKKLGLLEAGLHGWQPRSDHQIDPPPYCSNDHPPMIYDIGSIFFFFFNTSYQICFQENNQQKPFYVLHCVLKSVSENEKMKTIFCEGYNWKLVWINFWKCIPFPRRENCFWKQLPNSRRTHSVMEFLFGVEAIIDVPPKKLDLQRWTN